MEQHIEYETAVLDRQAFYELIIEESKTLKLSLTASEKNNLCICRGIDPRANSIYNQLTGSSTSDRALDLYPKQMAHMSKVFGWYFRFSEGVVKIKRKGDLTPIEVFCYMLNSNKDDLILYIKGYTDVFNPKFD